MLTIYGGTDWAASMKAASEFVVHHSNAWDIYLHTNDVNEKSHNENQKLLPALHMTSPGTSVGSTGADAGRPWLNLAVENEKTSLKRCRCASSCSSGLCASGTDDCLKCNSAAP